MESPEVSGEEGARRRRVRKHKQGLMSQQREQEEKEAMGGEEGEGEQEGEEEAKEKKPKKKASKKQQYDQQGSLVTLGKGPKVVTQSQHRKSKKHEQVTAEMMMLQPLDAEELLRLQRKNTFPMRMMNPLCLRCVLFPCKWQVWGDIPLELKRASHNCVTLFNSKGIPPTVHVLRVVSGAIILIP